MKRSMLAATRLVPTSCGGSFSAQDGHYRDNVVVHAKPVSGGRASR